MYYHYFDLKEYFETTQKTYHFLDGLFILDNQTKEFILSELEIPSSTYRTCRLKRNTRNNIHDIILKYFNYNKLDKDNKLSYEICLSKVYYAIYYKKHDNLDYLENELNKYINHKNILEPVFKLFSLLIKLTKDKISSESSSIIKYLSTFKSNYFTSEFQYIINTIFYFLYNKIDDEYMEISSLNNRFSWMFYITKAELEHKKGNLMNSINNYELSLKNFEQFFNLERYISTINNICLIYNELEFYSKSLSISNRLLHHTYNNDLELKTVQDLISNNLYSNYMLKNYNESLILLSIIDTRIELLSDSSMVILMLTYYKLDYSFIRFPKELLNYVESKIELRNVFNHIFNDKELKDSIITESTILIRALNKKL